MKARWTQKGSAYITKDTNMVPYYPSNPLDAVKYVVEGRLCPDREDDELSRGLGNKEHPGTIRGLPDNTPWSTAIPEDRKKFPDRNHQRRKEREAQEASAAADRLRNIEETIKRQQDQIDALS